MKPRHRMLVYIVSREEFIKTYQDRMAGELLIAVRRFLELVPEGATQAALLGHWVIDVTKHARAHGGELYDLLQQTQPEGPTTLKLNRGP